MGKSHTPEDRTSKKDRELTEKSKRKSKTVGSSRASKVADPSSEQEGSETKKPRKSSKKRRLEQHEAGPVDVPAGAADTEASDAPKKKRKRKNDDLDTLAVASLAPGTMEVDDSTSVSRAADAIEDGSNSKSKKKGEKKSRKDKKKDSQESVVPSSPVSSNTPVNSEHTPQPPATKEERRKKRKENKDESNAIESQDEDAPKRKKSKSSKSQIFDAPPSPSKPHKNKTDFSDPAGDESLNPQARKALEYAFTQFNDPSNWKFNKAKQNWLIRNVWSDESIPDIYLPLAIKYLTRIHGGSRDKLTETCTSVLTKPAPEAEPTNPSKTVESSTETPSKPKSILKPTATNNSAQPIAGALIAAVPQAPKEPTVDNKKQRAQLLLDALTSSS